MKTHFSKSAFFTLLFLLLITHQITEQKAHAQSSLPFDLNALLSSQSAAIDAVVAPINNVLDQLITTIGFISEHRPYQPATALGMKGFDLGVDATLSKISPSLISAFSTAGVSIPASANVLPFGRVHFHKGFGDSFDLGVSWIGYQQFKVWGADAKWTFIQPEEGPHIAIRATYSFGKIYFVECNTYSAQLLMSQAFDFFDPYFGVGYVVTNGKATVDIALPSPLPVLSYSRTAPQKSAFTVFGGTVFRLYTTGLKLTFEGGYHSHGESFMGTKVSFGF